MGDEEECVFSGAVCLLQDQIDGKPAEPALCLLVETGALELGRVQLSSLLPQPP